MDILAALKQEETSLKKQSKAIRAAIIALNGSRIASIDTPEFVPKKGGHKRTMSAAGRAKISKATKARWAQFRAEKKKRRK